MEDLTKVAESVTRFRNYPGLGAAYSFDISYSLIVDQFKVGDTFAYKGKTYEIKVLLDFETFLNFICLRRDLDTHPRAHPLP
jgi:hypothetical protein